MQRPRCLAVYACAIGLFLLPFLSLNLWAQIVAPDVRNVSEAFVCQCDCNHQLSACGMLNCPSASPLRQEIASQLKQGMNKQQIVNAFVAKYGKVILSAPTTRGFDLAAWTLPFVMLLLGFIIVFIIIRTWLRPKRAEPAGINLDVPIPEAYQKQIERELKNFD
jgi:cytochrome c-type biogenesis protein CcmH